MKTVLGAIALVTCSAVASAQTDEKNPTLNSLTACLYFLGLHNLPFEFSVNDVRKTAISVCKGQMDRYNAAMNPAVPPAKLAYGNGEGEKVVKQTEYAQPIVEFFLADYAKQLKILKGK